MTTEKILFTLASDRFRFTNWLKWDAKECAEYVQGHFNCSRYLAKKVGRIICKWQ